MNIEPFIFTKTSSDEKHWARLMAHDRNRPICVLHVLPSGGSIANMC